MLFQINDLSKSIHNIDADRFSIKEFINNQTKVAFTLVALVMLSTGVYWHTKNQAWNTVADDWNRVVDDWSYGEEEIRQQYYDDIEVFKATGKSYEEFYDYMYNRHKYNMLSSTPFFILMYLSWLVLLIIAWFTPLMQPVKADRVHRILYTWRWGRLYAASIQHFSYELQERSRFLSIREGGPLIVTLSSADGKFKSIKLGTYPSQIQRQNKALLDVIHAFAKREFDFPQDFTPKKGFLERFTFWRLKFPSDDKLDKAINEWKASRRVR